MTSIWGRSVSLIMTLLMFPNRNEIHFERGKAVIQPNRQYFSTEEVAQLFGFSVRTITAWAAEWLESGGRQGIPAFKMGRSWRFERQQIQAYVDSKKIPSHQTERKAANTSIAATAGRKR